ncbi:hypothetical protein M569_17136, partial [Genlisea aurea]
MASACVNNIGIPAQETFIDRPAVKHQPYLWLSPIISSGNASSKPSDEKVSSDDCEADLAKSEIADPDFGVHDFEFCCEDPVSILPADELFADGKLVPLHNSLIRQSTAAVSVADLTPEETMKSPRRSEMSGSDPYFISPKAPKCSSRWKDLLGLKKPNQSYSIGKDDGRTAPHNQSRAAAARSLKFFLHRSSKSALDPSLSLPLLQEIETESLSISTRLSLSSASSGHEHEEHPRLSLDSEKSAAAAAAAAAPRTSTQNMSSKVVRVTKPRPAEKYAVTNRACRNPVSRPSESAILPALGGVSIDSPRMNPSGKIVFHGLERSSSSPSSLNGGPRYKHRGMERSYSANVRITPVLNVPVGSLRGSSKSSVFGFPLFSSQQKKKDLHHHHHSQP